MATGDSPCNLCRSLTRVPVDMERREGREKSEQESVSAGPVGITPGLAFEDGAWSRRHPWVGEHPF